MAREITAAAGGTTRVTYSYARSWPITIAVRVRFSTYTSVYPVAFCVNGATSGDSIAILQMASGEGYQIAGSVWDQSEATGSFIHPGPSSPPLDRWYPCVLRVAASNDREFDYRDPIADSNYDGDESDTLQALTLDTTVLGNSYGTSWAESLDGAWAEPAVWDVALTDGEVAAYLYGVSPPLIRPSALTWYDNQVRGNRPDRIGGTVGTETGTIIEAPHPPGILYPSSSLPPGIAGVGGTTYQRAIIEGLKAGG